MLIFLKTEKKVSIFKNIRIRVEGDSAREKKMHLHEILFQVFTLQT